MTFKLRGFFHKSGNGYLAIVPALDISQPGRSIDLALELLLTNLACKQIKAELKLIEGNGFIIESLSEEDLVKLVLDTKSA